jgi:sulfonate transport system substrate-binding protein
VKRVLAVYEQARLWTLEHQSEARQILAVEAKLTDAVATKVWERTDFTNSAIGPIQRETIRASGDILKQNQVINPGTDVDRVVADLVDPEYFPSEVVNK